MANKDASLHIFFFPFLAHGHTIPCIDMAILFAAKGVRTTIITTPLNAPIISKAIEKTKEINIQTIKFPSTDHTGLPQGCEHVSTLPSLHLLPAFHKATTLLQEPFEQLLRDQHPNCVVADMFFPWTTDSAAKFGIPRLVFHGMSFFSLCAYEVMRLYEPYNNTSFDSELFLLPNFPGQIKMTRLQVGSFFRKDDVDANRFWKQIHESEVRSYGVVVNSFYEVEKDYADHYRKEFGRKAWAIGPLSLCNKEKEPKTYRGGKEACVDEVENAWLKWLNTKTTGSVVYVCFGSMTEFRDSQSREIALGLEASGKEFMWVVGKRKENKEDQWLPEGFEKRMKEKGMIIRGWVPQALILEHEAIGAFVTHCGWNSTLEGVVAGVPMITWPVGAEQFYNERLVIEVLKIGVAVGARKWSHFVGDEDGDIKWDAVEMAVKRVMEEEEGEAMRIRAKLFARMAKRAVEEEGSSYSDLDALLQELASLSH
ncbi:hypothetical protein ACSQ67_005808 [Phaseolus vulgaris]